MNTWIVLWNLIGTIAFAVSGAMTGLRKKMDMLGVIVLGLTTAVGGGIVRDLMLGITPPSIFSDPLSVTAAAVTAALFFVPAVRRCLMKTRRAYELTLLLSDSLGLGIFTVIGAQTACRVLPDGSWFTVAFLGTVTGVGGGVLRDVMAGDMPYIFRKHIYACAALAGALVWEIVRRLWSEEAALLLGGGVVIVIRLLAAHYRWSLPKAKADEFVD